MKTFATEEERIEAIKGIDEDDPSKLPELEEFLKAEIVPQKPKTEDTPAETPPVQETPDSEAAKDLSTDKKPDADVPVDKPEGGEPNEIEALRAQIAEKESFIKENLGRIGDYSELKKKIADLEKVHSKKEGIPEKEVQLRESKLSDLRKQREKLLEKYPNPEDQLDGEYVTEMNKIQQGMLDEFDVMQHNMQIVQEKAIKASEKADSYISRREQEEADKRIEDALALQKKEIIAFSEKYPQFKMTKPFDEVDNEYKNYQKEITRVYFGRDPKDGQELSEAMQQFKRRSPGLMARLNAAGIAAEPTEDMKKYLGLCEIWDGYTGYRKDPLTGDYQYYEDGRVKPLMRRNLMTGEYEPDTYRSPEAYFNDKQAQEGYYTKQLIAAKIEGAKGAMKAMTQRDAGAVELGATETQGGVLQAKDEAFKRINEIDVERAVIMARQGDLSLLNEYNQLAKTLEWPVAEDLV
jgi:hypothetical protein